MKALLSLGLLAVAAAFAFLASSRADGLLSCHGQRAVLTINSAVCPDGTSETPLKTKGPISWAPDGLSAAVITSGENGQILLEVVSRTGEDVSLDALDPKRAGFLSWQAAWSPDGTKIAALIANRDRTYVVRVYRPGASGADRHTDYPLTGEEATASFFDKFRFAPRGDALLLSWGAVLVIDLEGGRVHHVTRGPALADWGSDGRSICYLGIDRAGEGFGLHKWDSDKQADKLLFDAADVAAAGLVRASWLLRGTLTLSMDGTMFAWTGGNGAKGDQLRVYRTTEDCFEPDAPAKSTDTALVAQIDWSPDSSAVVILEQGVGGKDASGQSMFNFDVNVLDLATLKKTTVASLPFNSLAIDALGLARFISWSR